MSRNSSNLNSVFYAETYHPIQAGSIDGTDILPHDNAVYRALLCSSAGLYDPFGDQNVIGGDPYCTVFVGRLSHLTTEHTLREAMSRYGTVKNLRLVRHIVTGASRGFAFVEYESESEMRQAYEDAHHSMIDDAEIIVDYNRQQLMPGWIPRRLGGGLGGKKESGQLRFGGRERPFRAPLRPIPWDDLKRLRIPPPPEGKYMSRFQVPSPPRQKVSPVDKEDSDKKSHKHSRNSHGRKRRSASRDHKSDERSSVDREDSSKTRHKHRDSRGSERRFVSRDHRSDERSSVDKEERSEKRHRHSSSSRPRDRSSTSHDHRSDERYSVDREERSHKRYKHSDHKY